jgi:hypothetical protein
VLTFYWNSKFPSHLHTHLHTPSFTPSFAPSSTPFSISSYSIRLLLCLLIGASELLVLLNLLNKRLKPSPQRCRQRLISQLPRKAQLTIQSLITPLQLTTSLESQSRARSARKENGSIRNEGHTYGCMGNSSWRSILRARQRLGDSIIETVECLKH